MRRPSKFTRLPEPVKEELGKLWRSGRYSVDELLARLKELGADVSRSGLHRGLDRYAKTTERYRRAQEYAAFVIDKLGAKPESDVARLVSELIKTQAFDALQQLAESDATADPESLMLLGRMIKDVTMADRHNLEFRRKVREEIVEKAAAAADRAAAKVAKQGGAKIDPKTLRAIREEIYGIVAPPAAPAGLSPAPRKRGAGGR